MGIADQMGWNNPLTQFVGGNRNTLMGFGAGLAGGRNIGEGVAGGLDRAMQGKQADDAFALQQETEAKRQDSINQTIEYMRSKGYDDLIAGVESGGMDMGAAWGEALRRGQPQSGPAPIEINGQLVNPSTGEVMGDYRTPEQPSLGSAPSGYQWNPDGTQSYIAGGPADPSTPAKTTEATRRNQQLASVIEPELATVEQNWSELSSGGNQAGGMVPGIGNALTSPGYQQATNALSTIAQSYLYSVSGAAAPAEEVRKLVDSVTPKPFESPQSIEAKLARVRQMATAVQAAAGSAPQTSMPPGGQTSSGLSWSFEP